MGIVGTAASNNPQKGYDRAFDSAGNPVPDHIKHPPTFVLAHEGQDVSKPGGRALNAFYASCAN